MNMVTMLRRCARPPFVDFAETSAGLRVYSVVMTYKKLVPIMFVALLFGCGTGGAAPHVEVGERPYKKLTWDDFQLIDSSDTGMSAQTGTFIGFSFEWTVSRSGFGFVARPTRVKIESGMDPANSWRVRDVRGGALDLLLAHEQLHYDMNEIGARKLRAMLLEEWGTGSGSTADAASADLNSKIGAITTAALDEIKRLGEQYDSETAHGTKVEAQRRWSRDIDGQIGSG